MFCQNCGQENVSSAKFCVRCGTRILMPKAGEPESDGTIHPDVDRPVRKSDAGADETIIMKSKELNIAGFHFGMGELLFYLGCALGVVSTILPFFSIPGTQIGSTIIGGVSVNLVSRGFWWLILIWACSVVASIRGIPIVGALSGGFTLLFAIYFLVSYLMNGTSIAIGLPVLLLASLLMIGGSACLLLKSGKRGRIVSGVDEVSSKYCETFDHFERRDRSSSSEESNRSFSSPRTFSEKQCSEEGTPQESFVTCPKCGRQEKAGANYCGVCGARLSVDERSE